MAKININKLTTEEIIRIAGKINAKKNALEGLTKEEAVKERARIKRIRGRNRRANLAEG